MDLELQERVKKGIEGGEFGCWIRICGDVEDVEDTGYSEGDFGGGENSEDE